MNTENIDKTRFLPLLNEKFDKELSEEIIQFPVIEFPAGFQIGQENETFTFFPFVIKGSVRLVRYDSSHNEILIYNVNPMQSCVMSITAASGTFKVQGIGITNEDTVIFAIPNEKSDEWMEKYKSWRVFVTDLYARRLDELIRHHDLVSKQKDDIFQQKKEITDSINYAQLIQKAALPPDELIKSMLPEHFVFFRPRNIVSGDYYWLSQIENKAIVVVADCTGHGVPGAFMSMLGISLLNQMVSNHQDFSAGWVLDELRKQIKKSLRQAAENSESKDGMDLALMIFDFRKHELEYAGANNPIYVVSSQQPTLPTGKQVAICQLLEFKPDRMPVGIHHNDQKSFTSQTFHFEKGDMFYAFSDGFVDQFGGTKQRKFMTKKFKELIADIHAFPLSRQSEILDKTLSEWKGDNEQTDDILVIGIRT